MFLPLVFKVYGQITRLKGISFFPLLYFTLFILFCLHKFTFLLLLLFLIIEVFWFQVLFLLIFNDSLFIIFDFCFSVLRFMLLIFHRWFVSFHSGSFSHKIGLIKCQFLFWNLMPRFLNCYFLQLTSEVLIWFFLTTSFINQVFLFIFGLLQVSQRFHGIIDLLKRFCLSECVFRFIAIEFIFHILCLHLKDL